jgi:hypothetical protein
VVSRALPVQAAEKKSGIFALLWRAHFEKTPSEGSADAPR